MPRPALQVLYKERGQTYLFRLAQGHLAYSDLNTKVVLKKRKRGRAGSGSAGDGDDAFLQPEKFVLVLPSGSPAGQEEAAAAAAQRQEPVDGGAPQQRQEHDEPPPGELPVEGMDVDGDTAARSVNELDAVGAVEGEGDPRAAAAAATLRDVFGSDEEDDS